MSSLPKTELPAASSDGDFQALIERANHLRSAETGRLLRKLLGLPPTGGPEAGSEKG